MNDIQQAIDAVENIYSSTSSEIDLNLTNPDSEIVIKGNEAGLIYLSLQILKLAKKQAKGSHIHLDQYSGMMETEKPLTIVKINEN